MPRRKGSVNYMNQLLIPIVSELLPKGDLDWQAVAAAYQEQVKEEFLRKSADLKNHWNKKNCCGTTGNGTAAHGKALGIQ